MISYFGMRMWAGTVLNVKGGGLDLLEEGERAWEMHKSSWTPWPGSVRYGISCSLLLLCSYVLYLFWCKHVRSQSAVPRPAFFPFSRSSAHFGGGSAHLRGGSASAGTPEFPLHLKLARRRRVLGRSLSLVSRAWCRAAGWRGQTTTNQFPSRSRCKR
jgi:hypothetical protein